jgi:hypothetical protein
MAVVNKFNADLFDRPLSTKELLHGSFDMTMPEPVILDTCGYASRAVNKNHEEIGLKIAMVGLRGHYTSGDVTFEVEAPYGRHSVLTVFLTAPLYASTFKDPHRYMDVVTYRGGFYATFQNEAKDADKERAREWARETAKELIADCLNRMGQEARMAYSVEDVPAEKLSMAMTGAMHEHKERLERRTAEERRREVMLDRDAMKYVSTPNNQNPEFYRGAKISQHVVTKRKEPEVKKPIEPQYLEGQGVW